MRVGGGEAPADLCHATSLLVAPMRRIEPAPTFKKAIKERCAAFVHDTFDLLHRDDGGTRPAPPVDRKRRLQALLVASRPGPHPSLLVAVHGTRCGAGGVVQSRSGERIGVARARCRGG